MKVLLVGSSGLVGNAIISELEHTLLYNPSSNELDVTDYDSIKSYCFEFKIDVIINATAAFVNKGDFSVFHVNSLGSINLAKIADEMNMKKFIQISTIFSLNTTENQYFNSYGLSKLLSDEYIQLVALNSQCDYYILRCSQIFSSENLKEQPFLAFLLNSIIEKKDIVLYGTHNPKRNFVTTKVISRIVSHLLLDTTSNNNCRNIVFNIVNNKQRNLEEYIKWFANILELNVSVKFDSTKENLLNYSIPEPDNRLIPYLSEVDVSLKEELLKYAKT